ncbi:MAG TPA: DUF2062 domain-containing protein [Thermoanaerobaculia bacterium]|nr:DUF2062 domain-containing protein [Thermoanaerobaculia bacterium]
MTFRSSGAFRKRRHGLSWRRRRRILLLEFLGREDSLEHVAAAIALGVALGFSPFLGFHLVLALGLATILKVNRLDAALGTFAGNPWTFPPVFALGYRLGRALLHQDPHRTPPMNWKALLHSDITWIFHPVQTVRLVFGPRAFLPRLHAFLLGTTILAILIGAVTYFLALSALRLYHRRHPRVAARAALRRKAESEETRIIQSQIPGPGSRVAIRRKNRSDGDSDHLVN